MSGLDHCLLTGETIRNHHYDGSYHSYQVEIDEQLFSFKVCEKCFSDPKRAQIRKDNPNVFQEHILTALLLNGKLQQLEGKGIHWRNEKGKERDPEKFVFLEEVLANTNFPRTLTERLDHLFLHILHLQKYDGDDIVKFLVTGFPYGNKLYFRNILEAGFYLRTLEAQGLIQASPNVTEATSFQITFEGLQHGIQLQESGHQSQRCFIALAFAPEMQATRTAIKAACTATGFTPIIIDEIDYGIDQTINDALISEIKRCRFCIADFTRNRNAVYWEAGFALGLGKQVILTCAASDFEAVDFDTRAFPHIVYQDEAELQRLLIDRIEARVL